MSICLPPVWISSESQLTFLGVFLLLLVPNQILFPPSSLLLCMLSPLSSLLSLFVPLYLLPPSLSPPALSSSVLPSLTLFSSPPSLSPPLASPTSLPLHPAVTETGVCAPAVSAVTEASRASRVSRGARHRHLCDGQASRGRSRDAVTPGARS